MSFHVAARFLAVFALFAFAHGFNCCCSRLVSALGSHVKSRGSALYNESNSYWAEQQNLQSPSCVVLPTNAHDVSSVLVTLVKNSCSFAIRGGGHSSTKGASNIDGGVVIDMRGLNSTTLNADNSLVTVGAGQTWGPAYSILQAAGVTIPGGRNNAIGIGGSILGGALGYIAPQVGFGADSVVEYEVVLANGSIVTANKNLNSELFRSLKGGGSNFGILTKLVIETIPIGGIWISNSAYNVSAKESIIQTFYDFTANPDYDPKANLLMNYHYAGTDGFVEFANQYTYAAPVEKPAAFDGFYPIEGQLGNTSALTNLGAYSVEQDSGSPDGLWQITFATSFKNSIQQFEDVFTAFVNSLPSVAAVEGISWSLTFEPIPLRLAAASNARGGNILGLNVPPEGVILTLGSFTFNLADDYAVTENAAKKLLSDIIAAGKKNGVYESWIDLNHAYHTQNPFQSYGSTNYEFLKTTANKYDPTGVFQKLAPGGFKL